jgi:hypothetical protein
VIPCGCRSRPEPLLASGDVETHGHKVRCVLIDQQTLIRGVRRGNAEFSERSHNQTLIDAAHDQKLTLSMLSFLKNGGGPTTHSNLRPRSERVYYEADARHGGDGDYVSLREVISFAIRAHGTVTAFEVGTSIRSMTEKPQARSGRPNLPVPALATVPNDHECRDFFRTRREADLRYAAREAHDVPK